MNSLSADDQHDDHCRLTFSGQDWWIFAKCGDQIGLVNENGRAVLDISNVNWPSYIAAAEALIEQRREA